MDSLSSHLSPPHIPARTVQDADRDIADLRLAMIGMGKTMANWLDTVEESCSNAASEERLKQALQGMRRLQETLIQGATTTTAELAKDWSWSNELATTPSGNSSVSIDSPFEVDILPLEAVAGDMSIAGGAHVEKADSQQAENIELPPNTFAMETSSTMTPRNAASAYLHSPSSFSRKPRFQYTAHPTSNERLAENATINQPASIARESIDPPLPLLENLAIASDIEPHHLVAMPSVSTADAETSGAEKRSPANMDVDPLSGQVAVNSEYGGSGHGPKRFSKDLRGLGIL